MFNPNNAPNPNVPSSLVLERVVRCLRADIEATERARHHVSGGPAGVDLSYLDRLIHKPWGSEFRVYEDDLTDVWCLHIASKQRTSLHCHPHKHTALLCLEGKGTLGTYSDVRYALEPEVVLLIEPGAYHRIAASSRTGLTLVEIETPKDKFDLLRIADDYRDLTEPYEGEDHASLRLLNHDFARAAPLALQPFVEQPLAAIRRARLRTQKSTSRYRFAVETGQQLYASINLAFAIALKPRSERRSSTSPRASVTRRSPRASRTSTR
jgi:mannose-6-phosphate isomerase-like protein (cupin superfamily)